MYWRVHSQSTTEIGTKKKRITLHFGQPKLPKIHGEKKHIMKKTGPTCDQLLWNTFSAGGSDIGDVLELLGVLFVDNFLCFSRIGDSHT